MRSTLSVIGKIMNAFVALLYLDNKNNIEQS